MKPGKRIAAVVAAVVVAAVIAGTYVLTRDRAVHPATAPPTITVRGTLRMDLPARMSKEIAEITGAEYHPRVLGESCVPPGSGYSDIRPGATVTVTDGVGTTVALGALGQGVVVADAKLEEVEDCLFNFL